MTVSLLRKVASRPEKFYQFMQGQAVMNRRDWLHSELKRTLLEQEKHIQQISKIEFERSVLHELGDWLVKPFVLERAKGSAIHRFNESVQLQFPENGDFVQQFSKLKQEKFHCFVVEHNLASAFESVDGFDVGEVLPPYDDMIFEFQVSGSRCMFVISKQDDTWKGLIYIDCNKAWLSSRHVSKLNVELGIWEGDEEFKSVVDFMWRQIRAVFICLDAEIATEELIRAPEALNRERLKKGRPTLSNYSIIKLLHRKKHMPFISSQPDATAKRRLHFVRGHWRHYEAHKTWIKWFLRGDIDLGVVDKEYRL